MFCEQLIFVRETTSTNDYLADLYTSTLGKKQELKDFSVVYADFQTAGKGLARNTWHSEPGENILASFFFKPHIRPQEQFYFNVFFSLSVKKTLDRYVDMVKIKWPNDIYIQSRKIAGILIEHTVIGDFLEHSIAGIGVNLNQTIFHPSVSNPTSLKLETGFQYERLALIKQIIADGASFYAMLQKGDFRSLLNEYHQHLYRFKEFYEYRIKGISLLVRIIGTNEYGQLLLEEKNGKLHVCGYKEVEYL